jgi:hypothetical protein
MKSLTRIITIAAIDDVFGLRTLHVWTQRANPSGLSASWNPRVHGS